MKTPSPQEAAKTTNREIGKKIALRVYPDKHPLNVMVLRTEIERALDPKDAALLEADKNGYERGRKEVIDNISDVLCEHQDESDLEIIRAVVQFIDKATLTLFGSVSEGKP